MQKIQDSPGSHLTSDITDTGGRIWHCSLSWGQAAQEKSHFIYEKIIKESMEYRNRQYLVIVPEQSTLQTRRNWCPCIPEGGC